MSDTSHSPARQRRTMLLIALFTVLVLVLAFVARPLGGDANEIGPGLILWGASPALVALALRLFTRDWSDVGMRPGLRRNARWYLVSFLVYPAVIAVALVVGVATGVDTITDFDAGRYFGLTMVALAGLLISSFFEEFGWRGYLVPKLAELGINRYVAHVFLGVVWATWHLPFISSLDWRFLGEDTATLTPRFYLLCIASGIVYNEIREITGTIWPAVLMHAAGNAFGHLMALDYLRIEPGKQWLGSISNSVVTIVVFALVGVLIIRWRSRRMERVEVAAG